MHFEENEYEVDEEVFQKKEMGNLENVKSFSEAVSKCGYNSDDAVPRRDLVLIYQKTKQDMTTSMTKYAKNGYYDLAEEYKRRLASLRVDYDTRQQKNIQSTIEFQRNRFCEAQSNVTSKLRDDHNDKVRQVQEYCIQKEIDHEETYRIKWELLEERIDHMKIPVVKFSQRMIEMISEEDHLNKLQKYDEARRVRAMIDKLKPREEKIFYQKYEKSLEKMRDDLRQEEERDRKKLHEAIKTIEWNDIRQRQLEHKITKQRFENHERDMKHSHQHELHLRPETSLYPSALWLKRPGFKQTSSFHRGQQLLYVSKGRKISGNEEFAETLIDKHDFNNPLEGTKTQSVK